MDAPVAPSAEPLAAGTRLVPEPRLEELGPGLIAGGSPWRLLRVSGASNDALGRWRAGTPVAPGEERLARTLVDAGLFFVDAEPPGDSVDVVVPVRDDPVRLTRLLDRLAGLDVTVVDDASSDAGGVAAAAGRSGARLVRLDEPRGPGAARNVGAAQGDADLVWFLDADVDPLDAPATLDALRAPFSDPRVGAVAARVVGPGGPGARDRFEARFSPLDQGARDALVRPGGAVAYVPAACLLVRRSALGAGFDEALRVGEDVDLVWRLGAAGWLVRYVAGAVVEHPARDSWGAWWRQRVAYGRSAALLRERHGPAAAPLRADRVTAIAWAGALAGAPWLLARVAAASRASTRRRLGDAPGTREASAALVRRGLLRAAGPLSRSVVRGYAPLLVAALASRRTRRRAIAVWCVGAAWRFRDARPRPADVLLGVADDLAYSVGVWSGAWRARSARSLAPALSASALSWREVLGR